MMIFEECNKFLDLGLKGDGSLKRGCGRGKCIVQ
jgi:hypothetical protein